jgi:hypothetical protein
VAHSRSRELIVGLTVGAVASTIWLLRCLRGFSDAVERGDFDEAQRQLRLAYIVFGPLWLKRPPDDDGDEPSD